MKEILYNWFGLNPWLFKLLNGLQGTPVYYDTMLAISRMADHTSFKYYVLLLFLWWLKDVYVQKYRQQLPITRLQVRQEIAVFSALVMGFLLSGFIVGAMKSLIHMPRPFAVPELRAMIHFAGPYPNPQDYHASFPSGHAAMAAFMVAVLWHKLNYPQFRYIGVVFVGLVCWARIAIGMHFPADVLAGVAIGLGVACIIRRYVYRALQLPLPIVGLAVRYPSIFDKVESTHVSEPQVHKKLWKRLK